jgi:hypothetical protein
MNNTFNIVETTFTDWVDGMIVVQNDLSVFFKGIFQIQKNNVFAVSH